MRSAPSVPTPCFLSALRDLGETLGMLAPAETQESLAPRYAPSPPGRQDGPGLLSKAAGSMPALPPW